MTAHRIAQDLFEACADYLPILDPGNGETIRVDKQFAYLPIETTGAETRTLADPDRAGLVFYVGMKTDGGDCVITTSTAFTPSGDTTFTLDDAGDIIALLSVQSGSSFVWRVLAESGVLDIEQTTQGFLGLSLYDLRETSNFDVGAIAANGGVLASDTTPVLDAINAATDGCQRVLWAASNNDQVTFQSPLPPDLDTDSDLVLHLRIASGGTTDAVGFTVESFFNEGDTKVSDTSGTNQTTTFTEVTATIAAADIPDGAQTLTVGLTPVAHTTDTLALSALWLEYTKKSVN